MNDMAANLPAFSDRAKPRLVVGEIVDREAVEIGELYVKARTSIVDSVRYQIECGARLAEKKASMPHGEWLPWLQANAGVLGFDARGERRRARSELKKTKRR